MAAYLEHYFFYWGIMRPQFNSWVRKIWWRRDRLPTPVFLGFPCGSAGKESACNVGDLGLVPGLGRSPGEGKGYPLQYSGLENSIDCRVHGIAKSWTQLSNFHFHFFIIVYNFVQRNVYIYSLDLNPTFHPLRHPSHLGHRRTQSWAPYVEH